jgi:hypothetical protein
MLTSKTFTSYQVLEIFMSVILGGILIYAGMQLHSDQDKILGLCKCRGKLELPGVGERRLSQEELDVREAAAIEDSKKTGAAEPFNNTLGWLLIIMGAGIILLGLYRLFMKGSSIQ